MLRISASLAVGLAATVVLTACGSSSNSANSGSTSAATGTSAGTATTAATGTPQSVAFSNPVGSQPGQQDIVKGFQAAAKELGWTAKSFDANLSPDKQVSDIATMLTQKFDGIASWTLDPGAAAGAYGQAKAANVPVVGVNSSGEGISSTVYWEVETCNGKTSPIDRTAQYIAKIKPHAKVMVISGPPAPSIQAYVKCFLAAAKTNGLDVVAQQANTKDASAPAQAIVADLLTKNPDVDAIWNYNDASALGASAAVTAAGKAVYSGSGNGIIVTGQNGDADGIAAIRDGRLTATWDNDPVATGFAMVKDLENFIGDKKTVSPPKDLVVKSTFWTKQNIATYKPGAERGYTLDNIPLVNVDIGGRPLICGRQQREEAPIPEVRVIARHRIAAGNEEAALALYSQVASATRREPGNLSFVVYRALADERDIVLLERYASNAAIDEHRNTAHFRDLVVAQLGPLLESRTLEIYDVAD